MDEFELIKKYFRWTSVDKSVIVGVGDDASVIDVAADKHLVSSVDTLIKGVHFANDCSADNIAYKALAVNLSDLAAMGAKPKYFTLALSLPELNQKWLSEFSASLKQLANKYKISLVGGDITKGGLSISINVMGTVTKNSAILRSSARTGDGIFVSNTLGDAAYARHLLANNKIPPRYYLQRLNKPEPRVLLGQKLLGLANACIDISDGIEQDLTHILKLSKVGASIDVNNFLLSTELLSYIKSSNNWHIVLAGGDDYELCFTAYKKNFNKVYAVAQKLDIALTQIGVITKKRGLIINNFNEKCQSYKHF